jgi:type I restriction enzyme S subunit
MSFPKYEKYKDSGVEWLGEVPEGWDVDRVKNIFMIGRGRVISNEEAKEDGSYPVFSSQTTNDGCLGYIETFDFDCDQLTWTTDGANAGTVFLRRGKHNCTNVCGTLQIKDGFNYNLRFGLYFLTFATQFYKRPDTNGAKIMNGEMAVIVMVVPTTFEQGIIAEFLDRETAKIDELVAEQQRLIEVLKEKRQAVISHAVTRGLNPNVKLKSSGIEWLGDVPAHWKVTPIKAVSSLFGRIGYRGYTTADIVDEGEGAITMSPSNMSNGIVSMEKSTYISWEKYNESPEIMVMPGDVVMVKTGSTFGKVSFISAVDHPTTINPQLVLFKKITCIPRFLFFMLNTTVIRALIEVNNSGSTIPTMSQESIGNFRFGLPTMSEQEAIVEFIDRELLKLATLNAEAQSAIDLLQERRTALISAAVTGKIDVRQFNKN